MKKQGHLQNLITRAIAGSAFVVVVIVSLIYGPWTTSALFLMFTIIGLRECYHLINNQPLVIPRYTGGYLIGVCIYVIMALYAQNLITTNWFLALIPLIVLLFSFELFYNEKFSLTHIGATFCGWIYVVLPFALINHLAWIDGSFNFHLPLGYFFLLWTNDTGAYLTGRWLGKHKLFEKVSPNKTWEGLIGGIALGFVIAWLLGIWFPEIPVSGWMIISAIIAVFGNLGDLFESLVKRGVGVKDSGNIIPGHGGVLDRFDGLFLSLPMVYFYLEIFVFK